MGKVAVGTTLELTALHTFYPKKVYVVQVKNGKVWMVDIPRTMPFPRFLREEKLFDYYKEVME